MRIMLVILIALNLLSCATKEPEVVPRPPEHVSRFVDEFTGIKTCYILKITPDKEESLRSQMMHMKPKCYDKTYEVLSYSAHYKLPHLGESIGVSRWYRDCYMPGPDRVGYSGNYMIGSIRGGASLVPDIVLGPRNREVLDVHPPVQSLIPLRYLMYAIEANPTGALRVRLDTPHARRIAAFPADELQMFLNECVPEESRKKEPTEY